nr:hypothetical protein [uncultured Roseobacter sp.]
MFEKQILGYFFQSGVIAGEIHGFHLHHINTGPDDMGMSSSVLLMEDNSAGLIVQP